MVPTTVNELATLLIELGYATDGVTPDPIITLVIDGVNHPVTSVLPASTTAVTMQTVVDIINNDAGVGPLVTASIEMDTVDNVPVLRLRGKTTDIHTVNFLNDLSFIANWGPDNVVQDINGTTLDGTTISSPSTEVKMLEPKPASPTFDEVYIPYHTEVVSDTPVLDINYWANLKYDTLDNANSIPCSVVAAKHPTSGVDIVYIVYVNYTDVIVEARFANGANSGQQVPDLTNGAVGFQPLPTGWIDTYWTTPRVLSAALAYDATSQRLFLKSIISGSIYAESSYNAVNTTVLSVCELDPMLSPTLKWVHTTAHDTIQNVTQTGFGVYQRSDAGFIIDSEHNLIVACNLLIPRTDSYYGTQQFAPGVEITKLNPDGGLLWQEIIDSGRYIDNETNDPLNPYNILDGDYVQQADRFFEMPANVAVSATNDIFVCHGTCFHKLTKNGLAVWTKEFDQLSLGMSQYARLVTDIQVHATTGDVYVACCGFPAGFSSVGAILKFADDNTGISLECSGVTWLSEQPTISAEPWQANMTYNMYNPVSMKLDSASGKLIIATGLTRHGYDNYSSVAAGQMVLMEIDASTMNIVWSNDMSINSVAGQPDVALMSPMIASTSFNGQNVGSTTIDFVRSSQGTITSVCYSAPLYIGEGALGAVSPAGAVVAQTLANPTIANNTADTAADVRYAFESHTSYDLSSNTSTAAQMVGTPNVVYNGTPVIVDGGTYTTWHRSSFMNTVTNTLYTQYNDYTWILPPTTSYNKTSMFVKNIAEVGELILGGEIAPPTSAAGTALDRVGAFRASDSGLHYCTADYDGVTAIWKTLPFGVTGGRIKLDPICYNVNTSTLCGCPSDRIGDVYVMDNAVFYCTGTYDGTNGIWDPVLPMIGTGLNLTTSINVAYDPSNPALWPTNYYMNAYPVTISAVQTSTPSGYTIFNQYTYLSSTDSHNRNYASNVSTDSYIIWNDYYYYWASGYAVSITNATSNTTTGTYIQLSPPPGGVFAAGVSPYLRTGESITLMRSPTDQGTWNAISRQSPIRTITANASAGLTIDPRRSYRYKITMNTNYTVPYPPAYSPIDGEEFTISVYNNVTAYTCSWNSSYRWAGGTAPAALASNRMHIVTFTYMATGGFWVGTVVAQNVPIV